MAIFDRRTFHRLWMVAGAVAVAHISLSRDVGSRYGIINTSGPRTGCSVERKRAVVVVVVCGHPLAVPWLPMLFLDIPIRASALALLGELYYEVFLVLFARLVVIFCSLFMISVPWSLYQICSFSKEAGLGLQRALAIPLILWIGLGANTYQLKRSAVRNNDEPFEPFFLETQL
jgi:hypothetical protein